MYLLIGSASDPCCTLIGEILRDRGFTAVSLERPLSQPCRFSWRFACRNPGDGLCHESESHLSVDGLRDMTGHGLQGVLVRDISWYEPEGWTESDALYMATETQAAMLGWLWSIPAIVINRIPAWLWYRPRPPFVFWLSLLQRAGLRTPCIVISNDSVSLRKWRSGHPRGAVYSQLSTGEHFLVSTEKDWDGLEAIAHHSIVALTEPHGESYLACVVGERVIWNDDAPSMAPDITDSLVRFARLANLDFVQFILAEQPTELSAPPYEARVIVVVGVETYVQFHRFRPVVQHAIAEALTDLLTRSPAGSEMHSSSSASHMLERSAP